MERQKITFLNDPSKLPHNPKELLAPTRCRVLKAFCVGGKPVQPGETVTIERHLAYDLLKIGKVTLIQ